MNKRLTNRPVKTRATNKTIERRFSKVTEDMVDLISRIYQKQVLEALNQSTIDKFQDNQTGNFARAFKRVSNKVKRKLLRRFSNLRIERMSDEFLKKADRISRDQLYKSLESRLGIPAKQLAIKEGLTVRRSALILETALWVQKLRDETIELYTANSLRMMAQGNGIGEVLKEFSLLKEKRKNHAKFTARNQINNFNSLMTKARAQKVGIKRARWVTSGDERVRDSHVVRDGKEFDLDKGLFSSADGKTLLPATDFQCRCGYELIIEGET